MKVKYFNQSHADKGLMVGNPKGVSGQVSRISKGDQRGEL